jgi:aryl-alcohol dehydrogenase-like predicted oxidoreductase
MSPVSQTVSFGDRELRRIGLGTNRLTDTPANHAFLREAVDAGVQMIDTAHLYSSGESERAIGAALPLFPPELVVATKAGYHGGGPERLRAEIEESFERLRTDVIDLCYLHRPDPEVALPRILEVLAEYHGRGRIRNVGLSQVTVEEILLGRNVVPIAAVQHEFSLQQRRYEDVLDFCADEGVLFVPFFPLRGGGGAVDEIAARHDASPQQIKLAWLLHRSEAMLPIPGTLSLEHLKENLAALDVELSTAEFEELERL